MIGYMNEEEKKQLKVAYVNIEPRLFVRKVRKYIYIYNNK